MFPSIRPRRWPNNGAGFLLAQATGSRLYFQVSPFTVVL